ncbi:MAG: FkbM family methyltransferase, partial [Patescibacteria group bacterium]
RYCGGARFIDEVFVNEIYKSACPRLTIVDLGAYEGEFSFYCLPFAKDIYAVEPDPTPFSVMNGMVTKYKLEEVVRVFPVAISSETKMGLLHASGGGGSAVANEPDDKTVKVQLYTLNDFLKENSIEHVDILKMDIESSEKDILVAPDIGEALSKIDLIIGEDHGYRDLITKVLTDNGFVVTNDPAAFVAKRQ